MRRINNVFLFGFGEEIKCRYKVGSVYFSEKGNSSLVTRGWSPGPRLG